MSALPSDEWRDPTPAEAAVLAFIRATIVTGGAQSVADAVPQGAGLARWAEMRRIADLICEATAAFSGYVDYKAHNPESGLDAQAFADRQRAAVRRALGYTES